MLKFLLALCAVAGFALSALPVHAQNTRSWVASTGDNANPCTRTQPCASLSRALAVTNARGEINCVDAGEYNAEEGAIFIHTAVTIDCTSTGGTFLLSNGPLVIGVANGSVVFRGLTFNGAGTGGYGIVLNTYGGTVHTVFENLLIHGFTGRGIAAIAGVNAGSQTIVIKNVQITDSGVGIFVDTGTFTAATSARVTIQSSVISGNSANGIVLFSGTGRPARVVVEDSVIAANANIGILVNGADAMALVSNSTITANNTGVVAVNGGQILSYGNNEMHANVTTNGAFTGALPLQ